MLLLTLDELLSLTRASPTAWQHFRADHAFILKSHLLPIYNHYGHPAAIRLLMLLTRLRALRAQLRGKPRAEVEKKLDPIHTSLLSQHFVELPFEWESNLPILVMASDFIPEMQDVFRAWKGIFYHYERDLGKLPRRQTWIFVESFLRYECFCNLSYHPEGFLFRNMFNSKHFILKPFLGNDNAFPRDLRASTEAEARIIDVYTGDLFTDWRVSPTLNCSFNTPHYFVQWFASVLKSVDESLLSKVPKTTKYRKRRSVTAKRSQILRFVQRKDIENEYFSYHLALQGNVLLTHILSLNHRARNNYVVRAYSSFLASQPPSEPICPPDLEEMRCIMRNWRWGRFYPYDQTHGLDSPMDLNA
ncbi:hypothetical protein QSH57_015630 [Fusarium oxysporum f. sp. vasinfectum]|nr:hypothetical protein QSH57_015630 [Fusarium oxysporum f. sp. vasinfectum]